VPFSFPRHHLRCSSVAAARAAGYHTGLSRTPDCALLHFAYLGLLKYHLSEVSANKSAFSKMQRCAEVARRLAIFAVKKLCRFECKETRAARSNTEWNAVLQVFAF
jgi:hypothetical protein